MITLLWLALIVGGILWACIALSEIDTKKLAPDKKVGAPIDWDSLRRASAEISQPEEILVLQGPINCTACGKTVHAAGQLRGVGISQGTADKALDSGLSSALLLHAARSSLERDGWLVENQRAVCPSCKEAKS